MADPIIKIDVRDDTRRIVAELRADQREASKAQTRALNRTAEQLRTQAGKIIREEYNVTLRGIRQASKIRRANPNSRAQFAEVSFSGRPINLAEFGARAVNPWNVKGRSHRRRGGGASVQVKVRGSRKLIQGAFLAKLKTGQNAGKKGVFRRSGPESWAQIKFLPSLSIPQMTETRAINKALLLFADGRYVVNFQQALTSVTKGF